MLENISMLLGGLATALTPYNLLACVIGGVLGIFVGALPGIGAVAGCSLLLPITYKMDPTAAIIMLAGIYYGNMYGGAYSAILLNIPGDSPAVMTAVEGYPMTKRGQAGRALFTANFSSFLGGTIGIICLTLMGPLLANIGLKFGPAEMASLTFLALTSIGWMLGDDPKKGIIATGIGVMISTIGIDASSANFRYTFGTTGLLSGISFIPLVVGMFGFSQVLTLATSEDKQEDLNITLRLKDSILKGKEMLALIPQCIRTALLGGFVGFLPGAGGTTGSFLAYMMERKINRNRDKMGTDEGSIEGVSAVEAANNAASVGAFIPLMSLGIPGSSTTAVLLGGLMAWGLKPGPLLFQQEAKFCWSLIGSMYIGNVVCLIFGLAIIPFLVKLMKVPKNILIPIITVKEHTDVISADLCEMNLVSNVTGLVPAAPTMNYPIAKISELADIFIPVEDGGILTKTGVVDVFFHLHAPDEASFAGGEFVIVRCDNEKVWQLLTEKGHVVSRNGKYACIYEPYHFMGVETPASIILGDQLGIGTHPECRQVSVMAGVAKWDIPAGSVLSVAGHHHSIEGLMPQLLEYTACPEDVVPFYLLNGAQVTKDIRKGEKVSLSVIKLANNLVFEYYQEGLKL